MEEDKPLSMIQLELSYYKLVIAAGAYAQPNISGIPVVKQHALFL